MTNNDKEYGMENLLYKDEVLDVLSETRNVAQFVSFAPNLKQRFSRVLGFKANLFTGKVDAGLLIEKKS